MSEEIVPYTVVADCSDSCRAPSERCVHDSACHGFHGTCQPCCACRAGGSLKGIVILHTPYQIVGDVQIDIIEISHVEDMDHSDGSYGCSTYWRAIGRVHMLDSMIIVRYIANTREDLLMDNWVWEEVEYLEGWSKWVRYYRWYYKPIMDTVGAVISGASRTCKSTVSKYIEHICSR